jgi:TIR domain
MSRRDYRVFISHGTQDTWVAGQIAKSIREVGAVPFLDATDIPKGAKFKQMVHREIGSSDELIALFTPWSAKRSWVWIEIGAAWGQEKPVVAVFYGMKVADLEGSGQGKGILEDINVLDLNDFQSYLRELAARKAGVDSA